MRGKTEPVETDKDALAATDAIAQLTQRFEAEIAELKRRTEPKSTVRNEARVPHLGDWEQRIVERQERAREVRIQAKEEWYEALREKARREAPARAKRTAEEAELQERMIVKEREFRQLREELADLQRRPLEVAGGGVFGLVRTSNKV